MYLQAAAS
uniref:Uncharacterized protein n=1 Tax=Arundo donax TaxID=35708 RepID=A0A0A9Q487_ARUDO